MNSCVLVVATDAYMFVLHFGEELPTERDFGNFIDRYAVAVKKDFSGYFPQDLKTRSEVIMLAS